MTVALLVLAASSYFLPDALASLGGSPAAWAYVCYGLEACILWLALASAIHALPISTQIELMTARSICAWGAFEAAQRPVCRLAFPMDHPPQLAPGQGLCEAATGLPMTVVTILAALLLAAMVQEARHVRG